jgi:hypothetical protein
MQGAEREHHVASHRHRLPPLKSYFRAGATAVLLSVVFFATFVFSTVTTTYAGHLNRVHSPRSARARPFQCPPRVRRARLHSRPQGASPNDLESAGTRRNGRFSRCGLFRYDSLMRCRLMGH